MLIPKNPRFVPKAAARQRAVDLLQSLVPKAQEIRTRITNDVEFVDQGANFERILCPACGAILDGGWWQQAMKNASQTRFTDLSVTVPCCGAISSLNDLCYEWPAGFARFALEIDSPNADLDEGQIRLLEQALGCDLVKIWAHY
jgi:hypothetical protein